MPKNTIDKRMDGNDNCVFDIYGNSPKMSTYLLAMAVATSELYDIIEIDDGMRLLKSNILANTRGRKRIENEILGKKALNRKTISSILRTIFRFRILFTQNKANGEHHVNG